MSCDEDVGEVDEVDELVDKPSTKNGVAMNFLAIFDEMWIRATGPMETVHKLFAEFAK